MNIDQFNAWVSASGCERPADPNAIDWAAMTPQDIAAVNQMFDKAMGILAVERRKDEARREKEQRGAGFGDFRDRL